MPAEVQDKRAAESRPMKFKPFVLIFDNGSNGTMILPVNTLRVRMRWLRANFFNRRDRLGRQTVKPLGRIESMPDIPGMELSIKPHPTKSGWIDCRISDPLKDQPELLERITAVMQGASVIGRDAKRKAVDPTDFDMEPDVAKTFLLALRALVDKGWAIPQYNTTFPTAEEIAAMPGREIYDPANPFARKRQYAEDVLGAA